MNLETLERSQNVMKVWWQSRRHYDPACSLWEKHGLSAPTPHSRLALARVQMGDADKTFSEALDRAYGSDACNARYDLERNGASDELRRKRDAFHHASAHWQGLADQVRAQSTADFITREREIAESVLLATSRSQA